MSARLMLFDLYAGGHHRAYLEMLARAWVAGKREGRLDIFMPEALARDHPDFRAWLEAQDEKRIRAIRREVHLPEGDMGLRGVLANDAEHGRVLSELIARHKPQHVLAMYWDHLQASLAQRRLPRTTPISGIYFRPSFHYDGEPLTIRLRKRWLLRAAMSHPAVHRVLSLDPWATDAVRDPRMVAIPDGFDPVAGGASREEILGRWGLKPDTRVLLFFGVISARKGIHEALAAMPNLRTPATLVLSGRIPPGERGDVQSALASVDFPVIHDDRYVPDAEVQDQFAAADAVLVAYRRHIGSSNVLIRAAAAATPAVGPTYGMTGRQIMTHRLGETVDTADSAALAGAIDRVLRGESGFDAERARAFAAANTADRFAERVFAEVLGP
ncbi:MAG: glycosyltransferase [Rhodothermales bacterium]|nr:glycosyltransferase [Rhodothermales bacterium]MBO6781089.1 glycosyltransferase [Rhodothermales bacterium]